MAVALAVRTEHNWSHRDRKEEASSSDAPWSRGYLLRRYRIRQASNSLLATIAVTMFSGAWIENRVFLLATWLVIVVALAAVLVLAGLDAFATRHEYRRLKTAHSAERRELEAVLRQHQQSRSKRNGHASSTSFPTEDS